MIQVLGFARRAETGWTYSPFAIAVLTDYMREFPEVFEVLGHTRNQDTYVFSELWPDKR